MSEQDAEARAVLNEIKATLRLNKVKAQKPTDDSSKQMPLMKYVRAALRDENRGASGIYPTSIEPLTFGKIVGGKRRLGREKIAR